MSTNPTSTELAPMTGLEANARWGECDPNIINVEGRLRPIDKAHVNHLADSIRLTGQIQPIVLTFVDGKRKLVAGAHRVLACRHLNIEVQFVSFQKTMIDPKDWEPFLAIMELDENLIRSSFSNDEREKMFIVRLKNTSQIEKLRGSIKSANGTPNKSANGTPKTNKPRGNSAGAKWFTEAYTDVSVPKRTAMNKWHAFRESIGKPKLTPSAANKTHKTAFISYLEGNQADADAKAKQAETEAQEQLEAKAVRDIQDILGGLSEERGKAVLTILMETYP